MPTTEQTSSDGESTEQDTVPAEPSTKWIDGALEEGEFNVPDELRDDERFICYQKQADGGKSKKVPIKPTPNGTYPCDPTDMSNGVTFDEALDTVHATKRRRPDDDSFDGVGLIIDEGSPLVGIDLDDCFDADDGSIARYAMEILWAVPSYTEISPSGTGLHVLAYAPEGLQEDFKNKADVGPEEDCGLEIYDREHYFTFTGRTLETTSMEVRERGDAIRDIQKAWLGKADTLDEEECEFGATSTLDWTPEASDESGEMTDEDWDLVEDASEADGRFGELFRGENIGNQSEADFELACKLAWWTANAHGTKYESDVDAMVRIMKNSELSRPKYDRKLRNTTYLLYTIGKAIEENGER